MRNTLKINVRICYKVRRILYFYPFRLNGNPPCAKLKNRIELLNEFLLN